MQVALHADQSLARWLISVIPMEVVTITANANTSHILADVWKEMQTVYHNI